MTIPPTPEPYRIDRQTSYEYRDPAYDSWGRSFLGFRRVRVKQGFEQSVTETTYWFGPCQRGVKQCPQSSDDEEWKALSGQPVRVDRFIPEILGRRPERLLSITQYHYTNDTLFRTSDRAVRHSYPHTIETFLYDASEPFTPGDSVVLGKDHDPRADPARQRGREHIVETLQMDENGSVVKRVDEGRPSESGSANPGVDGRFTRVSRVHCNRAWQCLSDTETISSEPIVGPERKARLTYDALGKLTLAEIDLQGTVTLERHHEVASAEIAPSPATASTLGWKRLFSLDYDAFGNVVKIEGAGAASPCTTIRYDRPYAQFPEATEAHLAGCTSPSILATRVFDRGFGTIVSEKSPTGGLTEVHLDAFGRPVEVNSPQSDGAPFSSVKTLTFVYSDQSPLSWVQATRQTGTSPPLESIEVLNGLGELVFGFDRADPSAGDLGDWVMRDWSERDSAGRVSLVYRPSFFSGDPISIAAGVTSITAPASADRISYSYDSFGRPEFISDGAVLTAKYVYSPLAIEAFDAEQVKPTGPRAGLHTKRILDGHGRTASTITVVKGDEIQVDAKFLATGEPWKIVQSHTAGPETVTRVLQYDSLGRVVRNVEPNTSLSDGSSWRYAWDDAGRLVGTSDARGCGENIFYDGLGRILAEDYSPCRQAHATYTQPNVTTGDGTETFFRYDEYEREQVNPVPGFADNERLALGQLVSLQDRGAHTRFSYDNRGRVRRLSRRIAMPGTNSALLKNRYAAHWYESRREYDLANRLTSQTTGADLPELLVGGASFVSYSYTARGFLRQIASAYGILLSETRFDADGSARELVYGDAAATKASFGYDARRRLVKYNLGRTAPTIWGTTTPTYGLPGPDTTQLQLQAFTFTYDDAGNTLRIADISPPTAWPAGSLPTTRSIVYDDLYRVTRVDYETGLDRQISPYAAEEEASDRRSIPVRGGLRVGFQTFAYDWKGNTTGSDDDRKLRYDRSLGSIINGESVGKPNQLRSAGPGIEAQYDEAGNLIDLTVERTNCPGTPPLPCTHRFVYEWDEVGQLTRAMRWDYPGGEIPAAEASFPDSPTSKSVWDLHYAYSSGDRVLTTFRNRRGDERHTLDPFKTLRVGFAKVLTDDYERNPETTTAYLAGMGRLVYDPGLPSPTGDPRHIFLLLGDQLGSTSAAIDLKTGELAERTSYQAFGAIESDYRPKRWKSFREDFKFTAKEEDIEVGVTYFGMRYYNAHLGRFMSADPLTIHALGGDLNPYAYVSGRVMTHIDPLGLDKEAGCLGKEWCADVSQSQRDLERTKVGPLTESDGGTTGPPAPVPGPEPKAKPKAEDAPRSFDPAKDVNWIDRWIMRGDSGFHDAVTSDANWKAVHYVAGGIAIGAAAISTGGLALEAAEFVGLTAEGFGATVLVNSGRASMAFTELSLAEQGVVVGSGSATVLLHENGHFSIFTTVAGETLHTHQVRLDIGTRIYRVGPSVEPVINSIRIPLPNGPAAVSFQRGELNAIKGSYDLMTNNCTVHCADVLRAGGVTGVPSDTALLWRWLFP